MKDEFYLALLYRMTDSGIQYKVTQTTDHDAMAFTQYKGLKDWAETNELIQGWFLALLFQGEPIQQDQQNVQCIEKAKIPESNVSGSFQPGAIHEA